MNIHSHGGVVRRREEVQRIVRETPVASQDELVHLLRKRGFKVTQPTLSRDLRELGVARTSTGYVIPGVTSISTFVAQERRDARLEQLIREFVISCEAAGNLVVIKTPAASAQPVASAIDAADLHDVLGTVGGDDTIFIAFRHPASATSFSRRVHNITGLAPRRSA
jgi:transcriptional regulator of arginine metabolism